MSNTPLSPSSPAPDFTVPTDGNGTITLSALQGKNIVLYFYPKDDTPGCTIEAKDFSEAEEAFTQQNTVILGISKDNVKSHDKFKEKYCLPFPLLSDSDGSICDAYGTWIEKSMYGKKYMGIDRATFLIDQKGIIRQIWRKVSVTNHVKEVLAAVQSLNAAG